MIVILGRFPHNVRMAQAIGGTVLNMSEEAWDTLASSLPEDQIPLVVWEVAESVVVRGASPETWWEPLDLTL